MHRQGLKVQPASTAETRSEEGELQPRDERQEGAKHDGTEYP